MSLFDDVMAEVNKPAEEKPANKPAEKPAEKPAGEAGGEKGKGRFLTYGSAFDEFAKKPAGKREEASG